MPRPSTDPPLPTGREQARPDALVGRSSGGAGLGQRTTENPVTGERVRWLVTSKESGGRLARAEVCVRPGAASVPEHVHRVSEERLEPLAGELTVEMLGRRRVIRPGQRATIAPGVPHRWWNDGPEELRFVVEVTPPLGFESMIESIFALGREGRLRPDGRPRLLDLAAIAHAFRDEQQVTSPPAPLQRLVIPPLAALARATGHRPVRPAATT